MCFQQKAMGSDVKDNTVERCCSSVVLHKPTLVVIFVPSRFRSDSEQATPFPLLPSLLSLLFFPYATRGRLDLACVHCTRQALGRCCSGVP